MIKNEHTRLINQVKEYGRRLGGGGDFFNKYTATLRKTKSRIANFNSAENSKNVIIARTTIGGHRPISSEDIKDKGGKLAVRGRQPLYDLTADNLLNIERYLGVYSDKLPSTKTREDEFSKYGELVNAYKELAMDDESKQDPWTGYNVDKQFQYNKLPEDIKQVMEFWRRNYGETEPIELNENVIDAGLDARKATWIKNDNDNCDDLFRMIGVMPLLLWPLRLVYESCDYLLQMLSRNTCNMSP